MRHTWTFPAFVAALLASAGCAGHTRQAKAPVPPPVAATTVREIPGGVVTEGVVTMTARVEAVDLEKRIVTLRGPEGNVVDVEVGEEVRNLPQVRKGDEVVATYYESIAIALRRPGEAKAGVTSADTMKRAEPGEKPGATSAHQTTVTATVVGLNKRRSTLTVKAPSGKTVTVEVQDPSRLENVKIGDLVEVVYTEAVAISVEKPMPSNHH